MIKRTRLACFAIALAALTFIDSKVEAQSQVVRAAVVSANTATSTSFQLIGSGVSVHRMMWNVAGTVSAGACALQSSIDQVTWSTIIAAQTVTSNGGPTASVSGVYNYVRFNCTTAIVGTGNVTLLYIGSPSTGTGDNVIVTNTPLDVNVIGGTTGNSAASATGAAAPVNGDYQGVNIAGTLRGQTGVNPTGSVYAAQTDLASVGGSPTATGNGTAAGAIRVAVASDNSAQATTQSGTWTTQLNGSGNTAAVTAGNALRVDGSSVTQPISGTVTANAGTGVFSVQSNSANIATETTAAKLTQTQGSTTSGQSGPLIQGAVTTGAPTYTTAQTSPFSLDTSGSLRVNVTSGSTGNGASSNTGAAVPAQAGYTGANVGGTLRGVTGTNTSGAVYALDVNIAGGAAAGGTSSNFAAAVPSAGTAVGYSDGTNMQSPRAFDADSGGGTQYVAGVSLRKAASGGSVEAGTSSDPLRTDPVGTTNQPVLAKDGSGNAISSTASALYGIVRDAAGNARGANVNSSNQLSVTVDNQPTVQPGNTANTTPWLVNQDASKSVTTTMQSAAVASGNGTVLVTDGQAMAHLTVNCSSCDGTLTTVNFEGQNDGSNFTSIWAIKDGTNTIASSTVTAGLTYWTIPVSGFKQIRSRISGYTAGTITVTGTTNPTGQAPPVVNANIVANTATNQSSNIAQVAGTTTDTNSGTKSAGTMRVVLATDQPALTNKLLVTPDANSAVNIGQVGGSTVATVGTGILKVAIVDSTGTAISSTTDPCDGTLPTLVAISQTASTQVVTGTSAKKTHICKIVLNVSGSSSETVNIVEGTGSVCATGAVALVGSTTTANGMTMDSHGGFVVAGAGTAIPGTGTNVNTCITQSGSNRISGYLSYVQN